MSPSAGSDEVVPLPPSEDAAPNRSQKPSPSRHRTPSKRHSARPRWPLVLLTALAVFALALCAQRFLLSRPSPATDALPPVETEVTERTATEAYFRQENPNLPGRPFLDMTSEVEIRQSGDTELWMYTLTCRERNGLAFHIDRVESFAFLGDGVHVITATPEALQAQDLATTIEPHGEWAVEGGVPTQANPRGVGFAVRGTDDAGSPLSFVYYLTIGE